MTSSSYVSVGTRRQLYRVRFVTHPKIGCVTEVLIQRRFLFIRWWRVAYRDAGLSVEQFAAMTRSEKYRLVEQTVHAFERHCDCMESYYSQFPPRP